jgi:hypothetical protein
VLGRHPEGRHPEVQRPARQEGHRPAPPEQRCSAGFLDVAAVLPEALRPQAVRLAPLMELHSAQWRAARPVRPEAARPAVLDAVRCQARLSVVAAQMVRVRRRAEVPVAQLLAAEPKGVLRPVEQPVAWAEAAAEVQRELVVPSALAVQPKVAPGALAEWDAAAGPQRVAGSGAAEVLLPEVAAALDVAAVVPRQVAGAARGAAEAELRPAAEAVPDVAAEVRQRAARGAQGEPLSAAAWAAAPLSTRLRGDRPVPSPPARSAHAKESLRIAQP